MSARASLRPSLAMSDVREIGGEIASAVLAGGGTGNFDIAPDGRMLVAETAPDAFSLVVVRNWR